MYLSPSCKNVLSSIMHTSHPMKVVKIQNTSFVVVANMSAAYTLTGVVITAKQLSALQTDFPSAASVEVLGNPLMNASSYFEGDFVYSLVRDHALNLINSMMLGDSMLMRESSCWGLHVDEGIHVDGGLRSVCVSVMSLRLKHQHNITTEKLLNDLMASISLTL
jgi:hypothetical protein